jgi:hypothetical protein
MSLTTLLNQWEKWSLTYIENCKYDGWESEYENWGGLISESCKLLLKKNLSDEEFKAIDLVWKISFETEDLLNFSKKYLDDVWINVLKFQDSQYFETRSQIYQLLKCKEEGKKILLNALHVEADSYCKRVAFLQLLEFKDVDINYLFNKFSKDKDEYMRIASLEALKMIDDEDRVIKVLEEFKNDKSCIVRAAAIKQLSTLRKKPPTN